jgi:hypothetical protein
MSDTTEIDAQVAEAIESDIVVDNHEAPKPKIKVISALGQTWQIPAKPTVGFLAALADSAEADRDNDTTGQIIAGVAILRALLGKRQMKQVSSSDAESIDEFVKAANTAYEGVDTGN